MLCLVLEMSSEVKEATQAMEIAHEVAKKAGLTYYYIISAKRQDGFWLVQIDTIVRMYVVKINAFTGGVVEFTTVE